MKTDSKNCAFETRAIHAGQPPEPVTGAIMTPITLSTTYVQESPGKHQGYEYSRSSNPTRKAYEDCIASLESGKYGMAFASGCAAMTTLLHLMSSGDHLICMDDVYGGSFRLVDKVIKNNGIQADFVDLTDLSVFESAIKENTKMVWIESPTNPTMKLADIEGISKIARKNNIVVVVDNTFMSPYFQRPLELGAHVAYHSTSKYVNGHSDVIGGAIVVDEDALAERLYFLQNSIGAVASPFDSYLCMRSLKTLPVRMREHEKNAFAIAEFLENHEKVDRVLYPGLKSHPQHDLAKKQMHGFGGMITFYIKGGLDQARTFLENVSVFSLAESLGGVESLIEHPAIMTHASVPPENRKALGIEDTLIRLSVGIENLDDLLGDLKTAFGAVNL